MGRGAGLDAAQARPKLREERQDLAPAQLAADDHGTRFINAVSMPSDVSRPPHQKRSETKWTEAHRLTP